MKNVHFVALLFNCFISIVMAQQRGMMQVQIVSAQGEHIDLYRESHALVVGVSQYTHRWPNLPQATADTRQVKAALEKHGFNVTLLDNPTSDQIKKAIGQFIANKGSNPDNRLLFYFAGHGHTLQRSYGGNMGYIVPADAPMPDVDRPGFTEKAISMESFNEFSRNCDAKHMLFIFDSCFSGSIFALMRAIPSEAINYSTAKPVRQFITAGDEDEQVPDRSIFKEQLISALDGEADQNHDGYITGTELGTFLQDKVVNYSNNTQHPQYGKIRDNNLDKGDYVFVTHSKSSSSLPAKDRVPDRQIFDLGAYERKVEETLVRQKWEQWQLDMSLGYQKALELDNQAGLSVIEKVDIWQKFFDTFKDDNPFSVMDDSLLSVAQQKIALWNTAKVEEKNNSIAVIDEVPPPDFVPFIKEPQVIKRVEPEYPELSAKAGIEGVVWVKMWIDKLGKVKDVTILKSPNALLSLAATDAAKQWLFSPAMTKEGPVSVYISVSFTFKLN